MRCSPTANDTQPRIEFVDGIVQTARNLESFIALLLALRHPWTRGEQACKCPEMNSTVADICSIESRDFASRPDANQRLPVFPRSAAARNVRANSSRSSSIRRARLS
jgi:hypothetical protein